MSNPEKYQLSYIIATYNRISFLQVTLQKLLDNLQPLEEVVIVDAGSTDGTKEYLQILYEKGEIHQFISEPDRNQAHGWNKAMLSARGEIIKKIIDDDVFCYGAIRKCKDYMLSNPEVDVVISNDLNSSIAAPDIIAKASRLLQFTKWTEKQIESFTFGDVHLPIRRNSLSFTGLYNTSFIMIDWEYSLRLSYLQTRIVYYTGYNALSVYHRKSISATRDLEKIRLQGQKGEIFYNYSGDQSDISLWSKIKIHIGKFIFKKRKPVVDEDINQYNLLTIYNQFYTYIDSLNEEDNFTFLS